MRKFAFLLSAAALILAAGVVSAQDMSAVDPAGQTVVYWHQFSGAQLETMTALVEDFNINNEYGITVEAIAQGNYNDIRELMNAGIVSGELPNLVAGFANDAASYARDSAVVDLTPYINDPMWGLSADAMMDFQTDLLTFNTVDEAIVAFPHQTSAQVFLANTTLLAEAGFDGAPLDLETFQAAACAAAELTTANGGDIQGFPITTDASLFESFVAARGGRIWDGTAYLFDSEPVIATLQMYQDLYNQGCGYIPAERFAEQNDFALGLTPFFASSTAGFTFILQALVDNGFTGEMTVNAFPRDIENPVVQVFIPSIAMVPSTPEAELASWLFLKHLVSPEAAAQWSIGTGYFNPVPSTAALITADVYPNADLFPYFNTANELVNSADLYNGPSHPSYGAIRGLVSEAIANVTSNGMAVSDAVGALQDGAEQALADSM
jgi:ABC-type glycerol-3-phosphate transport system substrate-binding protein